MVVGVAADERGQIRRRNERGREQEGLHQAQLECMLDCKRAESQGSQQQRLAVQERGQGRICACAGACAFAAFEQQKGQKQQQQGKAEQGTLADTVVVVVVLQRLRERQQQRVLMMALETVKAMARQETEARAR